MDEITNFIDLGIKRWKDLVTFGNDFFEKNKGYEFIGFDNAIDNIFTGNYM